MDRDWFGGSDVFDRFDRYSGLLVATKTTEVAFKLSPDGQVNVEKQGLLILDSFWRCTSGPVKFSGG